MKNYNSFIKKYIKNHERHKKQLAAVVSMSLLVSFSVPMILTEPAVSMTRIDMDGGDILAQQLFYAGENMVSNIKGADGNIVDGVTYNPQYVSEVELLIGNGSELASGSNTASDVIAKAKSKYFLGIASDFCVFLEGDFTPKESDSEGRVAVGGNISFEKDAPDGNYQIGAGDYEDGTVLTKLPAYSDISGFAQLIVGGSLIKRVAPYTTKHKGDGDDFSIATPEEGLYKRFVVSSNFDFDNSTHSANVRWVNYAVADSLKYDEDDKENEKHTHFYKTYEDIIEATDEKAQIYQTSNENPLINFKEEFEWLRKQSEKLSKIDAIEGSLNNDTLTFTAPDNYTEKTIYFKINSFNNPSKINFVNIPDNVNIVVTCPDTKFSFDGETSINGKPIYKLRADNNGWDKKNNHPDSERILYNFPNATEGFINGNSNGTVFAPNADVGGKQVHLSGALIAKSFDGPTEFGYRPYRGTNEDIIGSDMGYSLPFSKVDARNKNLAGATFEIIDLGNNNAVGGEGENSDKTIGSFTSDGTDRTFVDFPSQVAFDGSKNYTADSEKTYTKTYIIKETSAPLGYICDESKQYKIIIDETVCTAHYGDLIPQGEGENLKTVPTHVNTHITVTPQTTSDGTTWADNTAENIYIELRDYYNEDFTKQIRRELTFKNFANAETGDKVCLNIDDGKVASIENGNVTSSGTSTAPAYKILNNKFVVNSESVKIAKEVPATDENGTVVTYTTPVDGEFPKGHDIKQISISGTAPSIESITFFYYSDFEQGVCSTKEITGFPVEDKSGWYSVNLNAIPNDINGKIIGMRIKTTGAENSNCNIQINEDKGSEWGELWKQSSISTTGTYDFGITVNIPDAETTSTATVETTTVETSEGETTTETTPTEATSKTTTTASFTLTTTTSAIAHTSYTVSNYDTVVSSYETTVVSYDVYSTVDMSSIQPQTKITGSDTEAIKSEATKVSEDIADNIIYPHRTKVDGKEYKYLPDALMVMPTLNPTPQFTNKDGLVFQKIKSDGSLLPGATIKLYKYVDGTNDTPIPLNWDSTKSTNVTIDPSKLNKNDIYYFKEEETPTGYETAKNIYFKKVTESSVDFIYYSTDYEKLSGDNFKTECSRIDMRKHGAEQQYINMTDYSIGGASLNLIKVDSQNHDLHLAGSKFVLYKGISQADESDSIQVYPLGENTEGFEVPQEGFNLLDTIRKADEGTYNPEFFVDGYLIPGDYYLLETKSPSGYNGDGSEFRFKVELNRETGKYEITPVAATADASDTLGPYLVVPYSNYPIGKGNNGFPKGYTDVKAIEFIVSAGASKEQDIYNWIDKKWINLQGDNNRISGLNGWHPLFSSSLGIYNVTDIGNNQYLVRFTVNENANNNTGTISILPTGSEDVQFQIQEDYIKVSEVRIYGKEVEGGSGNGGNTQTNNKHVQDIVYNSANSQISGIKVTLYYENGESESFNANQTEINQEKKLVDLNKDNVVGVKIELPNEANKNLNITIRKSDSENYLSSWWEYVDSNNKKVYTYGTVPKSDPPTSSTTAPQADGYGNFNSFSLPLENYSYTVPQSAPRRLSAPTATANKTDGTETQITSGENGVSCSISGTIHKGDTVTVHFRGTANSALQGCLGYNKASGGWNQISYNNPFNNETTKTINFLVPNVKYANDGSMQVQLWWSDHPVYVTGYEITCPHDSDYEEPDDPVEETPGSGGGSSTPSGLTPVELKLSTDGKVQKPTNEGVEGAEPAFADLGEDNKITGAKQVQIIFKSAPTASTSITINNDSPITFTNAPEGYDANTKTYTFTNENGFNIENLEINGDVTAIIILAGTTRYVYETRLEAILDPNDSTNQTLLIPNERTGDKIDITAKKSWLNDTNFAGEVRPTEIKIQLNRYKWVDNNGTLTLTLDNPKDATELSKYTQTVTSNNGVWECKWEDLDRFVDTRIVDSKGEISPHWFDENNNVRTVYKKDLKNLSFNPNPTYGYSVWKDDKEQHVNYLNTYFYKVTEESVPTNYTADNSNNIIYNESGTIRITNTLNTKKINVTKDWDLNGNDNSFIPESVEVKLQYRKPGETNDKWKDVMKTNEDKTRSVWTLTLTANTNWKGTFDNLPKDFEYQIVELNAPTGWELKGVSPEIVGSGNSDEKVTVTNELIVGSLKVSKEWNDNETPSGRPSNIKVNLWRSTDNTNVVDTSITNESKALGAYDNYAQALQYSLYFYDANMCGDKVDERSAVTWRGDCHTDDPVKGGFHDAGDHVMFGLPQGFTASTLGWSYYEFKNAYDSLGQTDHYQKIMKHFCEFFAKAIKTESGTTKILVQKGNGGTDHDSAYWGPPENNNYKRGNDIVWESNSGGDIAAQYAAALALYCVNFPDDSDYTTYLNKAKELFNYAVAHKNMYSCNEYGSKSSEDDISWAACCMALVDPSNKNNYLSNYCINLKDSPWNFSWDNMHLPATILHAELTGTESDESEWTPIVNDIDGFFNYGKVNGIYVLVDGWGSARYNTLYQFAALVAEKHGHNTNIKDKTYKDLAEEQMQYILGNNELKDANHGRSLVAGFGSDYPTQIHHRSIASSSNDNATILKYDDDNEKNRILVGALVGGPDANGSYSDSFSNHRTNEVALDYNAGFTAATAGLYALTGKGTTAENSTLQALGIDTSIYNSDPVSAVVYKEHTITSGTNDPLTFDIGDDIHKLIVSNATGVEWTSSNPDVVAVNEKGVITTKDWGTAKITATVNETTTYTVNVTVNCVVVKPNLPKSKEFVKELTLEPNSWSETINNLPVYDPNGQKYYYYIEEDATGMGGTILGIGNSCTYYPLSYTGNGVQLEKATEENANTKDITVTNKKYDSQGVMMPETGGTGTAGHTTAGILILLGGCAYGLISFRKRRKS